MDGAAAAELTHALSPAQHAAVHGVGHQLVVACPGAGKTRTLAYRAAHLLQRDRGIRIAACTFTVDAARELQNRIADLAPGTQRRVTAGTFHALAMTQLRSGGRKPARILSAFEQSSLIREAWKACAPTSTLQAVTEAIEGAKSTLQPQIDNVDANPPLAAFLHYQERLQAMGVCDFADLMRDAVLGMQQGEVSPLDVHALLVDEFQDADEVQLEWVNQHALAGIEVTVVGDDDQSLYGWRHALGFAGMERFRRTHGATRTVLDTCYRCAPSILEHARLLIEHNEQRVPKALLAHNAVDGQIRVDVVASRSAEVCLMAQTIAREPCTLTWAVLARTNALLDAAEAALTGEGIPYRRVGSKSFWDGPIAGLYRAVLRSLSKGDRLGIDLLLGRAIHSPAAREALSGYVGRPGMSFLDALVTAPPPLGGIAPVDVRVLKEWIEVLAQQRRLVQAGRMEALAHSLAERVARVFDGEQAAAVVGHCAATLCRLDGTVEQRLSAIDRAAKPAPESARVQLMTLHSSKGLEFDAVWMMACEHGALPHGKGELSEERRLAYVGMTRARRRLHLSAARALESDQSPIACSQFLTEAGLA